MIKPESLRMRLHEMNRPPEYLQAYPAEEMDKYLDELQADNARLREALKDAADRAVACVKGFTSEMRDLWSECEDQELRAAILAGEVKE
jgi:hypothetical protein